MQPAEYHLENLKHLQCGRPFTGFATDFLVSISSRVHIWTRLSQQFQTSTPYCSQMLPRCSRPGYSRAVGTRQLGTQSICEKLSITPPPLLFIYFFFFLSILILPINFSRHYPDTVYILVVVGFLCSRRKYTCHI